MTQLDFLRCFFQRLIGIGRSAFAPTPSCMRITYAAPRADQVATQKFIVPNRCNWPKRKSRSVIPGRANSAFICAGGLSRARPLVPDVLRLLSGFCSSLRSLGFGLLQLLPCGDAHALIFAFSSAKPWPQDFHLRSDVPCSTWVRVFIALTLPGERDLLVQHKVRARTRQGV